MPRSNRLFLQPSDPRTPREGEGRAGIAATLAGIALGWLSATSSSAEAPARAELGRRDALLDSAMTRTGSLLVVGRDGLIAILDPDTLRPQRRNDRSVPGLDYLAVTVTGDNQAWITDSRGGVWTGDPREFKWRRRARPAEGTLFDIAALSDGSLMAVGEFGTIVRKASTSDEWRAEELPWATVLKELWEREGEVVPNLYAICRERSGSAINVAGEYGLVLRFDGRSWQVSHAPSSQGNLFGCVERRDGTVLAFGQLGMVLIHPSGASQWEEASPLPHPFDLYDMAEVDDMLVAAGDQGVVVRSVDGRRWETWSLPERLGRPGWIASLNGSDDRGIVMAGNQGFVARMNPPAAQ